MVCVRLDGFHGKRSLVTGLRFIVVCSTVTLWCRLSSFIFSHWSDVTWLIAAVNNVCFLMKAVCACGWVSCACSSQKETEQEELKAGKAVYYTWTEPTGSRELCWKCGSYSGKLKSEEVL